MATPKLISPGVFTKENDLSFVPQGVAAIGAALVGLTPKGPAFVPTRVDSFSSFVGVFGDTDPQYYTTFAAKNYLANQSTLTVTRILSNTTNSIGNAVVLAFPPTSASAVLSASNTALAILRFRSDSGSNSAAITGSPSSFTLEAAGLSATNLSLDPSSNNFVKKVLGTDPLRVKSGDSVTSVYVDSTFDYAYGTATGSVTGSATAAFNQFVSGYQTGTSPIVVSQNYNGSVYNLFYVVSRTDGDASNYDVKISILVDSDQLSVSAFPSFTLFVRGYGDSDTGGKMDIRESFRCNLDPTSQAFIGKVIGDRYVTVDNSQNPPVIKYEGTYQNNSNYIRVVTYNNGDIPMYPGSARPSGFKGVSKINPGPTVAQLPYKSTNINLSSNEVDSSVFMGVDFTAAGVSDRIEGSVVSVSGTKASDKGFLTFAVSSEYNSTSTGSLTGTYVLVPSWGAAATDASTALAAGVTATVQRSGFTFPLVGGTDGFDPRTNKTELINSALSTEFIYAINALSNADEYDFNLIAVPGVNAGNTTNGNLAQRVVNMVSDRGDAFYIMDIADSSIASTSGAVDSTVNGVVTVAKSFDTSYAATYFPWVKIIDSNTQKQLWVPPSVDVFGVYAFNDRVGQQFYAPAGFNRGVMSSVEARYRLNIAQRDTLYAGKVNPIATFPGANGPVVWGQKTLQTKASALDRVNVRRLLIQAKKLISSVAKFYAFEPNTASVRDSLLNQINPILETMRLQQGIVQFRVILDESVNTPDIIDRNMLIGKVLIQPARIAEILQFEFSITRSGSTLFNQ